MAEPFVFHFRRGPDGHPEQMYLADVRAECALCGHPQLQRYYHSTRLHAVTVDVLSTLAAGVRSKTAYECPNCGSAVGPESCRATAFTWAFPDDAGLLRRFDDGRWQAVDGRRLDPQELPGWEPDPASTLPTVDHLDEGFPEEFLGRPVSVKSAIREGFAEWCDDPAGGALVTISPQMVVVVEGEGAPLGELAEEAADEVPGETLLVQIRDAVPHGLPTHQAPETMPGALRTWTPPRLRDAPLAAVIGESVIRESVRRAFDVANLKYEEDDEGFDSIVTPRDDPYPRDLGVLAIARRALYTGLTPGDAARLTAEEIVGNLLRVW